MTPSPYILPGIEIVRIPTEEKIQEYFTQQGYGIDLLRSRKRTQEVVLMRFIAMWNIRHHCGWKLESVALYFRRDHATVMHGLKKIEQWQEFDPICSGIINKHNQAIRMILGR